ncbi:MAG: substrate-binding domain-containing protein [Negativicutes bacterium]|nr:substrate-binding domain-containing protein [Negativicutes bacterium]
MKKLLLILLVAGLALLVAGCGDDKKQPASKTENRKKVVLIMKTLTNPFFVAMEQGARRAEKEFGVELSVKTAAKETSIEQQVALVEDAIRDKVDAIVIAPASSKDLVPALKKAQDAGIKVVVIDVALDPDVVKTVGMQPAPFVSVDNEEGAYLAAKVMANQVRGPVQAVILQGIMEAANAQARYNGALKAFNENPNITVVAAESAHWKIDEAKEVTAGLFAKYPGIKLIFACNDMMALGAIQYLDEAGKKDVNVGGYDAIDDALKMMKEGKLGVTVDQKPDEQGYTGVRYAVEMMKGQTPPPVTMLPVEIITVDKLK